MILYEILFSRRENKNNEKYSRHEMFTLLKTIDHGTFNNYKIIFIKIKIALYFFFNPTR